METVLHALKAMGKANSVELAARLDISPAKKFSTNCGNSKKMALLIKRVTPGFWLSKVKPG